jgi:hypothetical protein
VHDKPLSVIAVGICNKDCLSLGVDRCDAAQLQPALLSVSAMISKYFMRRIVSFFSPFGLLLRSAFSAALIQVGDRSHLKATCTVWFTTVAQNSRTFSWRMLDKYPGYSVITKERG